MYKRIAILIGTVFAVLMAVGIGSAIMGPGADDSAPAAEATSSTAETVTVETDGQQHVYEVSDAGSVTVVADGATLTVTAVDIADGWFAEVEVASGLEVEVDFRNGTRRIQFDAELEDGQIKARARESADNSSGDDNSNEDGVAFGDDNSSGDDTPGSDDKFGGDDNPDADNRVGTTSTTAAPGGSTTSTTAAPGGSDTNSTASYQAADAGSVTISSDGSTLTIVSVSPAAGWSHDIEVTSGREVEVDFRNGTRRIQFDAELEDGKVRIRARESVVDDGGSTTTTTQPPSTTSTTQPPSTTTTTTAPPAGDTTVTYDAGEGGTVTIKSNGSTLTVVSVSPAAGWSHEIEMASGIQVEVDFRNGDRRIQFDAELEDGQVRIRVRERTN